MKRISNFNNFDLALYSARELAKALPKGLLMEEVVEAPSASYDQDIDAYLGLSGSQKASLIRSLNKVQATDTIKDPKEKFTVQKSEFEESLVKTNSTMQEILAKDGGKDWIETTVATCRTQCQSFINKLKRLQEQTKLITLSS